MANEFKVKKGLIVDGSNTVLDIQGTQGQLFSVTDSLAGDLFSVSDVSGVPILNVNSSGAIDVDGTIESTGNITCHKNAPKIILKDIGTGNAMTSEFSFHDGNGVSRGYVGYGSSGNSTMYWQNTLGDLQFHTSSALCLTLSGTSATFVGNVDVDGGTLNVGSSNQVSIVSSGSSLFPSLKVNNSGYVGSASVTDSLKFLSSGDLQAKTKIGVGIDPTTLLHLHGTGDAIRVESTNTGAGGAQVDLLHFTTSPADADTHASINMGGYYTGTTSVYGTSIKSVWTDVSARQAKLTFTTRNGGDFIEALSLTHEQHAVFSKQILMESGTGGTTSKLIFKTTDNSDQSKWIRTNAYWVEHGGHANEGFKFIDTAATILLQLNGGAQTGGNGANSATFAGNVHAPNFYGNGSNLTGILTNPLNVDLTINSAGVAASPILRLNNSSSNSFNHALEAINANLTATETELLLFGKATSTRNSGFIGYNWNADNSNTNYVTIGHWGYNHLLKIFPTGDATFSGNITAKVGNFQAPDATASIINQFACDDGNNAATFRTTTSGRVFEIRSQNSGTLKFDSTSSTFTGNVDVTKSTTGEILSRIWNSDTSGNGTAAMRIANSGNQANGARLEFSDQNYYNATVSVDRTNGMRFMVHDDSTNMSDLLTHTVLTLADNKNATFAGNVTVSGTSSSFNTGNSGTFVTNDASNYPRFTMTNASAQVGLFRAGGNAGGMYIGGSGDGFRLYTSSFSQKLFIDTNGSSTQAGSASFNTNQAPIAKIQAGARTFSGGNGVFADSRVGIMNNGSLTSIVNASTYNDATYPEYGLVFIQGPSTSNYNVWSISPDGPARGTGLSFIFNANTTNIHTAAPKVYLDGGNGRVGIGNIYPESRLSISDYNKSSFSTAETLDYSITLGTANGNADGTSDELGPGIVWKFNDHTGSYTKKSAGIMQVGEGNYLRSGLAFYTNNNANTTSVWSEKMRLSMDGDLGVGTANPSAKLDIQGTQGQLFSVTDDLSGDLLSIADISGVPIFNVNASGAVDVDGTFTSSGTITSSADVVAYSDERLKTDVQTLDGSKVYNMRGVSFTKDNKKGSGVIAQELEKIAPELVNNDSQFKAVAYGNITGYLIEAIKELKSEIEQLKKQIK